MKPSALFFALRPALIVLSAVLIGCVPAEPPEAETDLEASVARMAAIGYAFGASFAPDGERIAFVSSGAGVPQVWIAKGDGTGLQQATFFDDQVTGALWSPAGDTLAVAVAPGGGLNSQIYLVPIDTGEARQITEGGKINNWLTGWSEDGRYLSYSSNADGAGGMDCYLYDTETSESRLIAVNEGIGQCELSPDNRHAAIWRMKSRGNTDLYLLQLGAGEEQLLTPHAGVALSDRVKFSGNDRLLISTNIGRERVALARIDLDENGVAGEPVIIAGRDDAELADFEILAGGQSAALLWNKAGRSELTYLDLASGELTPGPGLPAEIANGLLSDQEGEQLVMTVTGSASPTNVWRLLVSNGQFSQISDSAHEGVDLTTLVRPELRTYTAHDGLELSGWLYRPVGAAEPGPMVLSFHGGPEGQSRPSFRTIYQALVARGISVFAPNVRGSSGFGKTFVNLDNGALRFDGVRDIESTVRFVVESNLADPDRVGIMGGSYGGYMVMAGLTEYPDLFSAGANLFGVVNFETFFAQTEPWMAAISTVEYGDPVKDKELLQQLSPIHKVDRVTAPTIVLHGANDTNVPVVEAEQVVDSLEARGVPVKYVLFPDEGHGWRKTENRITSDVEIVRWFVSHL